jgi:carbamate kinase
LLGEIVITTGGGGIPVIEEADGTLSGVAAVIDKDLAAQKLALDINADTLLILTSVGQVALDYGTPKQRFLETMTVDEAKRYSVQRVRYDVQGTGYPDLADVMAAVE